MDVRDYLIEHEGFDWPALLAEWAWRLPPAFTVWLMNRFGDLFLVMPDGSVHMLDLGDGSLERLAGSRDEFCDRLDEDDNPNVWLMIPLVDDLVAAGRTPGPGQCYGFRVPPVLGGAYEVENVAILPIAERLGFSGSLHGQLRDVPDGTKVVLTINREGPHP